MGITSSNLFRYRPEIDGLRALAVVPVILFHAGFPFLSGGFVGVDIFFVISGYLITHILLSDLQQGRFSLIHFYERRARRILPALFLVMAASLPAAWLLLDIPHLKDFAQSLVAVSSFSANILFWLESGYWLPASELKPLIHTWSLAVEEQYYLFFPLLLMALWRFGLRWILWTLIFIGASSLLLAEWTAYQRPEAGFYLLPTRAWELMIGAGIAFFESYSSRSTISGFKKTVAEALSAVGLVMIGCAMVTFNQSTPFPGLYALIPTLGTGLIILFASQGTKVAQLLSIRPMVTIGLVSYSAYLWHQPLFAFTRHWMSKESDEALIFVFIPVTFGLAYLTYKYVETPFRDRLRISRKSIFTFSIAGLLLFLSLGLFIHFIGYRMSPYASADIVERKRQIDAIITERQQWIQARTCHYSGAWTGVALNDFIDNWACLSDDEADLKPTKLAIFGDSHSADKAMMLRIHHWDILQVGGPACPLVPSKRFDCNKLLTLFHEAVDQHDLDTVLIANKYEDIELQPKALQAMINYWSNRHPNIVLFSPMVDFPFWEKQFVRLGQHKFTPDFDRHQRFYEALSTLNLPDNVSILNTSTLFCSNDGRCFNHMTSDSLPLANQDHLSKSGAQSAGQKLIELLGLRAD